MAIKLEDKTNTEAVSATYPYGAIKDDTGLDDGTPVNKAVYNDFHQFFAKMLDESGVTANGFEDNATNGFQYFEALIKTNTINDLAYNGEFTEVLSSITATSSSNMTSIFVKDNIIYYTTSIYPNLVVYDMDTDTETFISTPGDAAGVFVTDDRIYVGDKTNGSEAIKVFLLDGTPVPAEDLEYTTDATTANPTQVFIYDNHAYVVDSGLNKITVWDLSTQSRVSGREISITGPNDIFVYNDIVYVLTIANGVFTYTYNTGAANSHAYGLDLPSSTSGGIFIYADKLYLANATSGKIYVYKLGVSDDGIGIRRESISSSNIFIKDNILYTSGIDRYAMQINPNRV